MALYMPEILFYRIAKGKWSFKSQPLSYRFTLQYNILEKVCCLKALSLQKHTFNTSKSIYMKDNHPIFT